MPQLGRMLDAILSIVGSAPPAQRGGQRGSYRGRGRQSNPSSQQGRYSRRDQTSSRNRTPARSPSAERGIRRSVSNQRTRNPEFHKRTKHIDVRFHFIRDLVNNGEIELVFVESKNQLADILTKPLQKSAFYNNVKLMHIE